MKEVYIIGTGGFAAELTEYIIDNNNNKQSEEIQIKGYFDINDNNYQIYNYSSPFLGSEDEYSFEEESYLYIAIGDNRIRNKIIESLKDKNVKYENFIHHSCLISSTSKLGKGNILCPYTIIGPNTIIGDFNLLNYRTALPHDCILGNNNVFSPNVNFTGYTIIKDNNFFGTSCSFTPNLKIGSNNKIQAGITVNKNIVNGNIVFTMDKIKLMELYNEK